MLLRRIDDISRDILNRLASNGLAFSLSHASKLALRAWLTDDFGEIRHSPPPSEKLPAVEPPSSVGGGAAFLLSEKKLAEK